MWLTVNLNILLFGPIYFLLAENIPLLPEFSKKAPQWVTLGPEPHLRGGWCDTHHEEARGQSALPPASSESSGDTWITALAFRPHFLTLYLRSNGHRWLIFHGREKMSSRSTVDRWHQTSSLSWKDEWEAASWVKCLLPSLLHPPAMRRSRWQKGQAEVASPSRDCPLTSSRADLLVPICLVVMSALQVAHSSSRKECYYRPLGSLSQCLPLSGHMGPYGKPLAAWL